jgi:ankyrin repeat protein
MSSPEITYLNVLKEQGWRYLQSLELGCQYGWVEVIRYTIDLINVFQVTKSLNLIIAAECGHVDIVEFLLQHEASPSEMAFTAAAKHGQTQILRILFSHNTRVNLSDLLSEAIINNHVDTARFILERHTKQPHLRDTLILPAIKGYTEMFQLFFSQNPDLDEETAGRVLTISAQNNHLEILQYLLSLRKWSSSQIQHALERAEKERCVDTAKLLKTL